MNVYIYQAAFLCEDCADKAREDLRRQGFAPEDAEDEYTYDSDDFPKGPYADGGGEADCPNHCDNCNVFLENPLTDEGVKYVRDAAVELRRVETLENGFGKCSGIAVDVWAPYYGIQVDPIICPNYRSGVTSCDCKYCVQQRASVDGES